MTALDYLFGPFLLPYMSRALLMLLILSATGGVIGVFVSLRGFEFVSDGITHAVFPGLVIGYAFGTQRGLLLGALVAAVVAAVLLAWLIRLGISQDAGTALVLATTFSVGVAIVSTRTSYVAELEALLFGRLLTVTAAQLAQAAVLTALAAALVLATARGQVSLAFDRTTALASGVRALATDLVLNIAIALVVVSASNAIGNLLVLAFLILPAAIARNLTGRWGWMIPLSMAAAAVVSWLALVLTFDLSVIRGVQLAPSGTVVLLMTAVYLATVAWRYRPRRPHDAGAVAA